MVLKMRGDHDGKNSKRKKEGQEKPLEGSGCEGAVHHVNGGMSETGPSGSPVQGFEQKRIVHNEVEKRRKDRIKQGISRIGQLLPPMTTAERQANGNSSERSTFLILEKAVDYITELKDKTEDFLLNKGEEVQAEEIKRLRSELTAVRGERENFECQLKAAGLITDPSGNWTFRKFDGAENLLHLMAASKEENNAVLTLPSGDAKDLETSKKKKASKSRRRNTLSAQIEQKNQAALLKQQAENNDAAAFKHEQRLNPLVNNMGLVNVGQNPALNPQILNPSMLGAAVPNGQGQLIIPGMNIVNPAAVNPASANASVNPGAVNPAVLNTPSAMNTTGLHPAAMNQAFMQNIAMDRCNGMVSYMSPNNISAFPQNNMADGFGLLQMAMRDAGIVATSVPSSAVPANTQSSSAALTTTVTSSAKTMSSAHLTSSDSSSPLHTLASLATDTQVSSASVAVSSAESSSQSHPMNVTGAANSTPQMNINMPLMNPGQCGLMQAVNPNIGLQMLAQNPNMPFNMLQSNGLGGIAMMPQQQGQIFYLNEQGIPMISQVPLQGIHGQPSQQIGVPPGNPHVGVTAQNAHMGQKDQKTAQDSAISEQQTRDNIFQFPTNMMQQQAQIPSGDVSGQGLSTKMNASASQNQFGINTVGSVADNTNSLLQAQQQFNQLLQASQLASLPAGMNAPANNLNQQNLGALNANANPETQMPNNPAGGATDNTMLPVNQANNMLAMNQNQRAGMQLPSALILPNGTIIPVVTQPQLLMGQNQPQLASSPVMNTGSNSVETSHQTSNTSGNSEPQKPSLSVETSCNAPVTVTTATTHQAGLLMTTNTVVTAPSKPISTSVAALTTTVVPTTVTGSVMTTQVQKHQQTKMVGVPSSSKVAIGKDPSVIRASIPAPALGSENQSGVLKNNPTTMLPNNQFMNNSGAIVLSLPTTPGQPPTSVLVDPTTMQVLGTLPQQQQSQPALPADSQQQQKPPVSAAEPPKKAKKGSQRKLKPKPPSEKSLPSKSPPKPATPSMPPPTTKPSEGNTQSENQQPDAVAQGADILAQATESIFSDISPSISNFYNPANEDNPLHIDTSAGDTEEDALVISPRKESSQRLQNSQAVYNKQPSSAFDLTDPSTSPYHFVESPPAAKEIMKKSKTKKSTASAGNKSGGAKRSNKKTPTASTSSKKTQPKEKATIPSKEPEEKQCSDMSQNEVTIPAEQEMKILNAIDMLKENVPENLQQNPPNSCSNETPPAAEYQPLFSTEVNNTTLNKQQTSVEIPETISFSENELSDVLDQVEKLGNSFSEETPQTPSTPTAKKSKSRKNKNESGTGDEHTVKKKKKMSHESNDLINTSLSMDSILASISSSPTNQQQNSKEPAEKKKGTEQQLTADFTTAVEETPLIMPMFPPSSDVSEKSVSPASSKKSKLSPGFSELTIVTDSNVTSVSVDNLINPLQIATSSPVISPQMNDMAKVMANSMKSPSLNSPSTSITNISPLQRSNGRKKDATQLNEVLNTDNNMSEFPSFFMPDNPETPQVPPGPQSLPCLSSNVTNTQSPTNSLTSPSSCKLPLEQRRPPSSTNLTNSGNTVLSNHQRSICSSNSSIDSSGPNGPQSASSTMNNQLTYSAETLFSPASNCSQLNTLPDIRSELNLSTNQTAPPLMHPSSQTNSHSQNSSPGTSRSRTSIYSAENFVQPSMNCESQSAPKPTFNRPQQEYSPKTTGRANPMNVGSESFNFSNIASNVPSNSRRRPNANTSTSNNMTPTSSSGFSFSLSGNTETTNTFSPQIGHHQFPFYPLHPSVTSSQPGNTEPSQDTNRKPDQLEAVGFPPFQPDGRSPHSFPSPQLNSENSHMNNLGQLSHQPFPHFPPVPEPPAASHDTGNMFHSQARLPTPSPTDKTNNSRSLSSNNTVRKQKDSSQARQPSTPSRDQQDGRNNNGMQRSTFVSTGLPSFYTPIRQQMPGPSPLETPPLHHLPQTTDTRVQNTYQPPMSNSNNPFGSDFSSVRIEGSSVQVQNSPSYGQHPQNSSAEPGKQNRSKSKQDIARRQGLIPVDSQIPSRGNTGRQTQTQHDPRPTHNASSHTPTPTTHMEQHQNQQAPQAVQPNRPQKSSKQSKSHQPARSKKSSKQSYSQDLVDPSAHHHLFDTPQGIGPYFGLPNRSPPPARSAQPDGPTYMPHFLTPSSRSIPNAVHKNPPELGGTFNQLFPSVRGQSGLGLNFQPGFGINPVHGGHGSAPQIKGHSSGVSVTQPMSSFNLTNIFPDVNNCSQSNGGLNISPMKFPHGNPIIPPQPGMEHNSLQHHHNPGMLYHNRTPGPPPVLHNAMSINSLIGHQHPGMGQINNTMGQTFHGYGHPSSFSVPHLNFAMHDH